MSGSQIDILYFETVPQLQVTLNSLVLCQHRLVWLLLKRKKITFVYKEPIWLLENRGAIFQLRFSIRLPNFIRRCLNLSANASSSLGSVSVSGCSPAAATAADITGWCTAEWPWCPICETYGKSILLVMSVWLWMPNYLAYPQSAYLNYWDDDGSSYGSYCGRSHVNAGAWVLKASLKWVQVLSSNPLDPTCPVGPWSDASEEEEKEKKG